MATTAVESLPALLSGLRKLKQCRSKTLVRGTNADLNTFITFGMDSREKKQGAIEEAETQTELCKEKFSVSDCRSVRDNYSGADSDDNTGKAMHKAGTIPSSHIRSEIANLHLGPSKPSKIKLNYQQSPDDAYKLLQVVAMHANHTLYSSQISQAFTMTHPNGELSNGASFWSEWMKRQQKSHPDKVFDFLIPRVKFLVINCGARAAFLSAGYQGRLQFWYDHFDEFAFIISKHAFEHTSNIWDLETLHGGGPEDPSGIAAKCRTFDRYIFGECCEEVFYYLIAGQTDPARKVMMAGWRTMTNKTTGSFMEALSLPDWRDLPCKIYSKGGRSATSMKVPALGDKRKRGLGKPNTGPRSKAIRR